MLERERGRETYLSLSRWCHELAGGAVVALPLEAVAAVRHLLRGRRGRRRRPAWFYCSCIHIYIYIYLFIYLFIFIHLFSYLFIIVCIYTVYTYIGLYVYVLIYLLKYLFALFLAGELFTNVGKSCKSA